MLFLTACSTKNLPEFRVKANTCDIAYTRYQATVTGYCQEAAATLPKSIPTIEKEIELRAIASIPEVFCIALK